jgi:hypothetical protein
MTKQLMIVAVTLLAVCTAATAQSSWPDRFTYAPASAVYGPREFSLDLFGGWASRDKGGSDQSAAGVGAGVNYFFFENIGVGLDTYADAFTAPYMLNLSGIYRYPISNTGFAPYAFGGFGRQWDHETRWTGHIGGGLEYRFNPKTGFFVDARGVFGGDDDYALCRFGFRLAF